MHCKIKFILSYLVKVYYRGHTCSIGSCQTSQSSVDTFLDLNGKRSWYITISLTKWKGTVIKSFCMGICKPLMLQGQAVLSSHQLCAVLQYLRLHHGAGQFPLHLPSWAWIIPRNSYPPKILFDEQPARKWYTSWDYSITYQGLGGRIIYKLVELQSINIIPGNIHCTLEHIAWKLDGL